MPNTLLCILKSNEPLILEQNYSDFEAQFICFPKVSNNDEENCSSNKAQYSKGLKPGARKSMRSVAANLYCIVWSFWYPQPFLSTPFCFQSRNLGDYQLSIFYIYADSISHFYISLLQLFLQTFIIFVKKNGEFFFTVVQVQPVKKQVNLQFYYNFLQAVKCNLLPAIIAIEQAIDFIIWALSLI